jgi:hypothetical protein
MAVGPVLPINTMFNDILYDVTVVVTVELVAAV